ncbi:hypothetical protein B0H34DRAFT_711307 [Crassisporium funariophilum]|nr:hypothetical protein B0H34DRAFT_711307 [Crassisporium funariophilum]
MIDRELSQILLSPTTTTTTMDGSISASASTIRTIHYTPTVHPPQPTSPNPMPTTPKSVSAPPSPAPEPHIALLLPSPPDSPSIGGDDSGDDSVSSFPSVSSSFFFSSSAAASRVHSRSHSHSRSRPHSDNGHGHASEHGLIIPSLTLPSALRRPTPYGQTLGDVRLLVLGAQGAGKSFLTGLLLEDNDDVVEVGAWDDADFGYSAGGGEAMAGKVLTASTDWVEHRDAHGLEKFEPTRNVEIVELPGYDLTTDKDELIAKLKDIIETPFHALSRVLHPDHRPSATIANLLASPSSPLYTAIIFLLPSSPTALDLSLIDALAPHIPTIALPRLPPSKRDHDHDPAPTSRLSAFKPASAVALRAGLFHSPETLAVLRAEAVDRFLRWREVERALCNIHSDVPPSADGFGRDLEQDAHEEGGRGKLAPVQGRTKWDKTTWEQEWMEDHSREVALARRARPSIRGRDREATITAGDMGTVHAPYVRERGVRRRRSKLPLVYSGFDTEDSIATDDTYEREREHSQHPQLSPRRASRLPQSYRFTDRTTNTNRSPSISFDPLHLPSLVLLSLSLLNPLRARVVELFGLGRAGFVRVESYADSASSASRSASRIASQSVSRSQSRSKSRSESESQSESRDGSECWYGYGYIGGEVKMWRVQMAVVGGLSFCVGLGVGLWVRWY